MIVVRHNKGGIGSYRAVYKLIIIPVSRNKFKTIIGVDKFNVLTINQKLNDVLCYLRCCLLPYNFLIF